MLNDVFMEAGLKSLMVNARKCLDDPEDYTARAEMMLDCTYGCNGIYALGNSQSGWPCHGMEHALSAYYDITHGEGLAIITPRWMRNILSEKTVHRFVKYGVNVFGIDSSLDKFEIAEKAIQATYDFFESIGIPMHLKEVGINESRLDEMAHHVAENEGLENAWAPLLEKDIADIFRASLYFFLDNRRQKVIYLHKTKRFVKLPIDRIQGICGAFLVRIPIAFIMQQTGNGSLFKIGLATPCSTVLQIIMCFAAYFIFSRSEAAALQNASKNA